MLARRLRPQSAVLSPTLVRWALIIGAALAIEALARSGTLSRTVVVPPSQVLDALRLITESRELFPHLGRTMLEACASFAIATAFGIPLGVLFWRVRYLARVLEPYLSALYAMPLVFFYPLLLALMGIGPWPIIAVASAMSFVPIAINTRVGFAEIPEVYPKLGRALGCSPLQMFRQLLFPAAAPHVFAGLTMGFVYALIGAIVMEFVLTDSGVGFAVQYNYHFFNSRKMYAYITVAIVLAVVINWLLSTAEKRVRRGR